MEGSVIIGKGYNMKRVAKRTRKGEGKLGAERKRKVQDERKLKGDKKGHRIKEGSEKSNGGNGSECGIRTDKPASGEQNQRYMQEMKLKTKDTRPQHTGTAKPPHIASTIRPEYRNLVIYPDIQYAIPAPTAAAATATQASDFQPNPDPRGASSTRDCCGSVAIAEGS